MPDLEKWEMQDPFEVTARREARAQREHRECGECIHKRMQFDSKGREAGYRCVFQKRIYGVRKCELFKTELS